MGAVVPFKPTFHVGPDLGRQVPAPDLRYGYRSQYTEISFAHLTSILDRADRGDTVDWADLAERMLRTDAHLASVYESRLAPIAGARWELDPGHGDPELAQRAADDCRDMLESLPRLEQVFFLVLHGIGVGYSVHEIEWTRRGSRVVPKHLHWLHPRRFRFDDRFQIFLYDDGRAWSYAPEEQRVHHDGAYGMRLTDSKYVVHIPQIVPSYAPSSGLLQTVTRPWWVSQWVTKYWLMGAEIAGNPRLRGKYPQNASPEAKAELREALESLAADGVITHSSDVEVMIDAPLAQGSASVWSALIDRMDAAKSKSIVGSTNNVESQKNGDRATAESQFSTTTLPRAERDGRALWSTIERDLFRPFLRFNIDRYGGRMPPVPRGKFVLYEEPVEIDELLVKTKSVRRDELRGSRGLEAWGPERGGDEIVSVDEFAAPALPASPSSAVLPAPSTQDKPDAAEGAATEKAADAALNGAQVTSLLEIVARVARGEIPRSTGIALITAAFPLSIEKAESIMGPVGTPEFVPSPEGGPVTEQPGGGAEPLASPPGGAVSADPFRLAERPWTTAAMLARGSAASPTSSPSKTKARGRKR